MSEICALTNILILQRFVYVLNHMTLDWDKLKPAIDVRSTFEELCCQLAESEAVPTGAKFIRKASPDAGIECYWNMPNGTQWGWQAKFFRTSPDPQQWQEIDKSVKTALQKHPKLTKYFLCLPTNRSDASIPRQKSFLDKWNIHVQKWQKTRNIKFEYWGTHEIESRLSHEENAGKIKYFFEKEFLSHNWFERHLKRSIEQAGPKYTQKFHVNLPLSKNFEALGRTIQFQDYFKKMFERINKDFSYAKIQLRSDTPVELDELTRHINHIEDILCHIDMSVKNIDFETIAKSAEATMNTVLKIIQKLKHGTEYISDKESSSYSKKPEPETYHLQSIQNHLYDLLRFIRSNSCLVANTGAMLLTGDAGTGKTHLLCDVAKRLFEEGRLGVLLYGGRFDNRNPKQQILEDLDLNCTFEEFMGALDAAGQAHNTKCLIIIDALNEGSGQKLWQNYLTDLLSTVSEYEWVAIAVSVRTQYEDHIITDYDLNKLTRFVHRGFGNQTKNAIKIFFDGNGIKHPNTPFLLSAFSNPQLLVLLCKGLKNKGLDRIPRGLRGITQIYDFFLDAVNHKLSSQSQLDYPDQQKLVHRAVEVIAAHMASTGTRLISYEDAVKCTGTICGSHDQSVHLVRSLHYEDILTSLPRTSSSNDEPSVQFSYERYGDHMIVKSYLKDTTEKNLSKLLDKNGILGTYLNDIDSHMWHRGIIDALSIQIPEKFSKELIEVRLDLVQSDLMLESFLDSLVWRHPSNVQNSVIQYVREYILDKRRLMDTFFRTVLTVSSDPKMPLNAEYLHEYLSGLDMGDRDSLWSIFLHNDFEGDGIVRHYIDWAWHVDKSSLKSEPVYLIALTLSWFFTSSNRYVRDRATKALVSLLSDRIEVFERIMPKFAGCNDPYVMERLFCAAYGCSIRSNDVERLQNLADLTYSIIFRNRVPPNILLRDYARGIIDRAFHVGATPDVDYQRVTPPYDQNWIKSFPTRKSIKDLKQTQNSPQSANSTSNMFFSLSGIDDFYRHIVGENRGTFPWSTVRLLSNKTSRETAFNKFQNTLTRSQQILWDAYYKIISRRNPVLLTKKNNQKRIHGSFTYPDCDETICKSRLVLRKKLSDEQRKIFDAYVEPYLILSSSRDPNNDLYHNPQDFLRWIIKRVFELGWTAERFETHDRNLSQYSYYNDTKPERIGKKYQWIAYSELLARACDNFEFQNSSFKRRFVEYNGPWQLITGRDIDPSLLISDTYSRQVQASNNSAWWFPFEYKNWDSRLKHVRWLKDTSNLPDFKSLLAVTDTDDKTEWLILGGYFNISQHVPSHTNTLDTYERNVSVHVKSYITKKSDVKNLYDWAKRQGWNDGKLPRYNYAYSPFLGELYWRELPLHANLIENTSWTREGDHWAKLPAPVYVTTHEYRLGSGDYDCSVGENIEILLPNKLLVDQMGLINKNDGTFVDSNGVVVAYDPTVKEPGPRVLLMRKDALLEFLGKGGYGIVWSAIGMKVAHDNWLQQDSHPGYMGVCGVYRMFRNKIIEGLNHKFVSPPPAKRNAS